MPATALRTGTVPPPRRKAAPNAMDPALAEKALAIHARLCPVYGCPIPYFHSLDPVSELVSSLLSHRTRNAESGRAFKALRARFPDWEAVIDADVLEIEAAIAKKPKVAAESTATVLYTPKQVNELGAVDIKTIADLALASVDEEKNLRAVSKTQRLSDARPVFWNLKSAAARRLGVNIGDLPRAAYGSCVRPC